MRANKPDMRAEIEFTLSNGLTVNAKATVVPALGDQYEIGMIRLYSLESGAELTEHIAINELEEAAILGDLVEAYESGAVNAASYSSPSELI